MNANSLALVDCFLFNSSVILFAVTFLRLNEPKVWHTLAELGSVCQNKPEKNGIKTTKKIVYVLSGKSKRQQKRGPW